MQLRQLDYLVALARERHFGRAAEACHVTQPALSAGIRKLETELGVQIVRREQRFEGFTPEGEQVLLWGRRILAERGLLEQTLAGMREGLTGTLRIGAIPTAMSVAPLITTPMHAKHPLVRFHLETMSSREIGTRLNDFDIDIGITYVDGESLGRVRAIGLYREEYVFVTPAESPWGGLPQIDWAEAAGADLVLLPRSMHNRRQLDRIFRESGAIARPVVETDTVSGIFAHVASMGLSSVVPHTSLASLALPRGTRAIRLPAPRHPLHIGLVLAGSAMQAPLAKAFIECARDLDLHRTLSQASEAALGLSGRLETRSPHGGRRGIQPSRDRPETVPDGQ